MPRPKSFDESAALDRAVELFWERGYEGTSIADLEERLGLGRQSIYNAFGDKHQLYLKALERYQDRSAEQHLAGLTAPGAGLEAIRRYFTTLVEGLTEPGPRKACLIANSILELAATDEDTRVRCASSRDAALRGFRRALRNAVEQLDLPKGFDVNGAALMLVTQMYGLSVMAKTGASRESLRGAAEAALANLK